MSEATYYSRPPYLFFLLQNLFANMTTAVPKSDCETSKNCEGDEEKVLSPSEPGVVAHDPVHDPEKQTQGTAVGEDSSSADSSSQLLVRTYLSYVK